MPQTPMMAEKDLADPKLPRFVIRAAQPNDLSDFFELALVAGAGFTSLPANEALLAERLDRSKAAFSGENGSLFLALEDVNAGRVVGCAAIKTGNTLRPDFLNFMIAHDRKSLSPTSIYGDLTEVGSLLVHPDYRQFGVGRWLAQSRYLMIAGDLNRFGHHLFSELRGIINEDSSSPFYDGVLASYLNLTYEEADYLCSHGRQAELNAMLPSAPIQLDDVGKAAEASIGCPHQDGQKALWFLEDEGFSFEGAIDLLDAGPLVVASSRDIKTIQESFEADVRVGNIQGDEAQMMILATGQGGAFRSVKGPGIVQDQSIICSPELMSRLRLKTGGLVRVCLDRVKAGRRIHQSDQAELASVES